MAFFNYIETFFFISLGITFILIILLVYHFKERISTLENKSESVLEIVNSIVKEINMLRNYQLQMHTFINQIGRGFNGGPENMEYSTQSQLPVSGSPNEKIKVNITDDDDDDDDETTTSDEELMSTDDKSDESSLVDTNDYIHDLDEIENLNKNSYFTTNPLNHSDDLEQIPQYNIINSLDSTGFSITPIGSDKYEQVNLNVESIDLTEEILKEEPIQDTKTILLEQPSEGDILIDTVVENSKEVYRKMNLQSLKTFVITKGLCSDPSKMKKGELLKLIESELL
jgi:hypothetical protein